MLKFIILGIGLFLGHFAIAQTARQPVSCHAVVTDEKSQLDDDGIVESTTTVQVDRVFNDVVLSMDPQNWQQCSPNYFQETDLATPARLPGSAYSGILAEHFLFDSGLGIVEFENDLNVSTQIGPSQVWQLQYSLNKSIYSRLSSGLFFHAQKAGMAIDEGYIKIVQTGANSQEVSVLKKVRFDMYSPWLPLWTPGVQNSFTAPLLKMGDALAAQVCCPQ